MNGPEQAAYDLWLERQQVESYLETYSKTVQMLRVTEKQLAETTTALKEAEKAIAEMTGKRACMCETLACTEAQLGEASSRITELEAERDKAIAEVVICRHALQTWKDSYSWSTPSAWKEALKLRDNILASTTVAADHMERVKRMEDALEAAQAREETK